MSNHLAPEKIARIAEMSRAGSTNREICTAVGVSKESVEKFGVGRGSMLRLARPLQLLRDDLERRGIEPECLDGFAEIAIAIQFSCPLHPNEKFDDMVMAGVCASCRREGMRRGHARLKMEGRGIVPPWHSSRKGR